MRLGERVASDAHDAGLLGAAPQKVGQLMLMMLAMLCGFGKMRDQLMLMMLGSWRQLHKKWAS